MSVVAKFQCESVEKTKAIGSDEITSVNVSLRAVVGYKADGSRDDENESWSKWTPSGQLTMYITNPACFDQFKTGKQYYITVDEVN
jgi:hypothetical protein